MVLDVPARPHLDVNHRRWAAKFHPLKLVACTAADAASADAFVAAKDTVDEETIAVIGAAAAAAVVVPTATHVSAAAAS